MGTMLGCGGEESECSKKDGPCGEQDDNSTATCCEGLQCRDSVCKMGVDTGMISPNAGDTADAVDFSAGDSSALRASSEVYVFASGGVGVACGALRDGKICCHRPRWA